METVSNSRGTLCLEHLLENRRPTTGELMVLNQVQYPGCNLSATRNARLNLVGVILSLSANQPKVQHGKSKRNCLPKNAIVENVQSGRGQSLNDVAPHAFPWRLEVDVPLLKG